LWAKFLFAAGGSLVPTVILVCLSDVMLRVGAWMTGLHVLGVVLLCAGLAGISVGLGARLPSIRETDPSKIAAGFGGTLNLMVSTAFIFAMILLLAVPCHLYFASLEMERWGAVERWGVEFTLADLRFWLTLSMAASLILAAAATVIPLRLGARELSRMEF
jgi:ABC-2 type transport system permease protein